MKYLVLAIIVALGLAGAASAFGGQRSPPVAPKPAADIIRGAVAAADATAERSVPWSGCPHAPVAAYQP